MVPGDMPVLSHGAVVLRAFEQRDVDLVLSVAGDPLIPLITTVPASGDARDAAAYIARQQAHLKSGIGYSFAIADAVTDEAVGQIGLWLRDLEQGRVTTGYWIGPRHRRHGYVTDALMAVSTWALGLDGVCRVQLFVEPWNEGSWRVAERCGYEREGLLRSWEQVGTQRRDMYAYSRVAQGTAAIDD